MEAYSQSFRPLSTDWLSQTPTKQREDSCSYTAACSATEAKAGWLAGARWDSKAFTSRTTERSIDPHTAAQHD